MQLEQCVAYGGPAMERTSGIRDVMDECMRVAELTSSKEAAVSAVVKSGRLMKKGGGLSRCGRHTWHWRYFEVREHILYYYASEVDSPTHTNTEPLGRPIGSMALTTATVAAPRTDRYKFYFTVTCKQTGLKFHLQAADRPDMMAWMHALTVRASAHTCSVHTCSVRTCSVHTCSAAVGCAWPQRLSMLRSPTFLNASTHDAYLTLALRPRRRSRRFPNPLAQRRVSFPRSSSRSRTSSAMRRHRETARCAPR